ncbi:MAG: short chain dehydrogenase [Panacagrimonas sp.]|jgi:NAD(P)-dependent dehydrogenase (short-subunit alcohol dehydrogenase family)|nr:SDR family oxidoreductase [Panacagrimonas sp.]MCC2655272.1 short chain dehydrogenase [Panacagrimonas sp.]
MPITSLRESKCLVTGAASGIGRAVAIAAAAEGAALFLTDIDAGALQGVADQIRASGGDVRIAQAFDITDVAAVERFACDVHEAHGSLDVVMNIAGIAIWGSISALGDEHWRRCIDVNLMGPIHVLRCFVPPMIEAKRGGHVVNVSSAAGLFGLPWHAAYSASKFGLRGLSEVLRFDLRRYRIGVTLVCPGAVDTGLVRTVQIVGIDTTTPEVMNLRGRFQKHAISPDKAARQILKGMLRNRYLVLTSFDVWLGYWGQRLFAWPYELVMRFMNDQLYAIARRQRRGPGSAP